MARLDPETLGTRSYVFARVAQNVDWGDEDDSDGDGLKDALVDVLYDPQVIKN